METFIVKLDNYEKSVVLDALMFRACSVNKEMATNIRMVYGNIKEQIKEQEK